jgi:hypothetical protein
MRRAAAGERRASLYVYAELTRRMTGTPLQAIHSAHDGIAVVEAAGAGVGDADRGEAWREPQAEQRSLSWSVRIGMSSGTFARSKVPRCPQAS